jgi:hypothetical protein
MAKIYDIEEFLDEKTFTYQLYADMEVAATGTSDVQVEFTDEVEVLKASWTVSGQAIPGMGQQQFGVVFSPNAIDIDALVFGLDSASGTGVVASYIFDNLAPMGSDTAFGLFNGDWELRQVGAIMNLYYNDVLTLTIPTAMPVGTPFFSASPWENGAFGGAISNLTIY